MKTYPLAPNGVFWTLQGEGAMRGKPMVFIRLAGCSVGCAGCDTDYSVAERVSVDEILARVLAVRKRPTRSEEPAWVWLTGGEPTDHDLTPLLDGLRCIHQSVALATSGVRKLTSGEFGFISVSPHDPKRWEQRSGTELKVVPGLNGFQMEDALPYTLNFHYRYVQPLWGPRRYPNASGGPDIVSFVHDDSHSLAWCRDWVLDHPDWALTDQGHKRWGLP